MDVSKKYNKHFAAAIKTFAKRDQEKVQEAHKYASTHLTHILRRGGENYAVHGLEVGLTLKEGINDASLLSVALLHDLLVHPDGKNLLTRAPLNGEERRLVKMMSKLRRLHIDENTKDLDTFVDAFLEDARLMPLRMAHRLNDVRHLQRFDEALQKEIAHESLHMYTSIAGRLGMHTWRYEMEDICFRKLHPEIVKKLEKKFQEYAGLDHASLTQSRKFLEQKLHQSGMSCRIEMRIKNFYSSYRKMILKNRNFEELTDRLALRIIVKNLKDCYQALGIVHEYMHPIPGKLKDYIGAPKENGYQSIHTVVYPLPGVTEQPIEVQIRTEEMHELCEFGPAAHGEYKNYVYTLRTQHSRVNLLRNFQWLRTEKRSPEQFKEALRTYFDENHVAVFDAQNNLYHIKKPATALDFLSHIHEKKVAKLKEIRINGRTSSLERPLQDGDIIEGKFGRKRSIQKSWLEICEHEKTTKQIQELLKK